MCMLTFLPPSVLPNIDRLRNGTVSNRDGHGWAIVVLDESGNGSHILTGHSMSAEAALEAFRLTREAHPQGPALFHSRYTTGGNVDEDNCHPYVVNGDPRTVMAHNGILCGVQQPAKDERSDTRYFADIWGGLFYPGSDPGHDFNLNSRRGRRRLRDWLTDANKFVILTVDPTFRRNHYVINSNQGIWEDDGCWYSNKGYKARTYGTGWGMSQDWYRDYPFHATTENVWERLARATRDDSTGGKYFVDKGSLPHLLPGLDNFTCEICGARDAMDAQLNYCRICGTCGDCFGDAMDEYSDNPCDCGWPTGTHPGRKSSIERAFGIREAMDAGGLGDDDDDTPGPVTLGPPTPKQESRTERTIARILKDWGVRG